MLAFNKWLPGKGIVAIREANDFHAYVMWYRHTGLVIRDDLDAEWIPLYDWEDSQGYNLFNQAFDLYFFRYEPHNANELLAEQQMLPAVPAAHTFDEVMRKMYMLIA